MADIDFNYPKSSSQRAIHVIGTVGGDNTQRYVRIRLTVTEGGTRNDVYYRTVSIAPTNTLYGYHATYNIAISPKVADSYTPIQTYAFSFTAQQ